MTVNGQFQPTMSMTSGTWYLMDFVAAMGDHVPEVEIRTGLGAAGTSACEMYLVALDGVYLNTAPRAASFVALMPGMRASAAVR